MGATVARSSGKEAGDTGRTSCCPETRSRKFVTLTRKLRFPFVLSLIALGCVLGAPSALASDTVAADAAFQEGRALMASGDLAAACARFEDSRRHEPAVGTELNLGECYERLGRLASAQRA